MNPLSWMGCKRSKIHILWGRGRGCDEKLPQISSLKMNREDPLPPNDPNTDINIRDRHFVSVIRTVPDWSGSPSGTLPCFDNNGDFPYQDIPFNVLNQPLENLFGQYEPLIGEDIELPCIWPADSPICSRAVMPTHVFDSPCLFVASGGMYVLPPCHYLPMSIQLYKRMNAIGALRGTFQTVGNEVWKVHDVARGFIFYDNKLFGLASGAIATITSPRRLDFMIAYFHARINGEDPFSVYTDAKLVDLVKKQRGPQHEEEKVIAMDKILKESGTAQLLYWHSNILGIHVYQLLSAFARYFQPLLEQFGTRVPGMSSASYTEGLEIFIYKLTLSVGKGYSGPAPPYYLLKDTKPDPQIKLENFLRYDFEERYRGLDDDPSGSDTAPRSFVRRILEPKTRKPLPNRDTRFGYYTPDKLSPLVTSELQRNVLSNQIADVTERARGMKRYRPRQTNPIEFEPLSKYPKLDF